MFESRKVIAAIPAGRKETTELLVSHLLAARDVIDECHLWLNTNRRDDLDYLKSLEAKWPDFFRCVPSRVPVDGNRSVACFYGEEYRQPGTICIKIDDDIVWLAADAIRNLMQFRVSNPQYFLVLADTWNNQLCDHVHQRCGLLSEEPFIDWNCGGASWKSGEIAERIHRQILGFIEEGKSPECFRRFERWHLRTDERCSINLICWNGEDLAALSPDGLQTPLGNGEDEAYLSCDAPKKLGKINTICGSAVAAHYSFHTQKAYLDRTDILARWRKLAADAGLRTSRGN